MLTTDTTQRIAPTSPLGQFLAGALFPAALLLPVQLLVLLVLPPFVGDCSGEAFLTTCRHSLLVGDAVVLSLLVGGLFLRFIHSRLQLAIGAALGWTFALAFIALSW